MPYCIEISNAMLRNEHLWNQSRFTEDHILSMTTYIHMVVGKWD